MIWDLALKHRHASLFNVEAAVAKAVYKFNAENEIASGRILRELNITPGPQSSKRTIEKDQLRAAASARKRTSVKNEQGALKKHHLGASSRVDYIPGACEEFDSGINTYIFLPHFLKTHTLDSLQICHWDISASKTGRSKITAMTRR